MAEVSLHIDAPPADVFAVLSDGWTYASWVVGASHIRAVDDAWPAVGSRIHHSVGPWPVTVEDTTSVNAMVPERMIELDARAWPFGMARVRLDLEPDGSGTRVTMTENATQGPAKLLPAGLQAVMLVPRNREALHRLSALTLGRARDPHRHTPGTPGTP